MDNIYLMEVIKEMAYAGKEYEEIIKELQRYKEEMGEESIRLATNQIDDYIVNYLLAKQEKSKGLNKVVLGLTLFFIGIGVTGYTYFDSDSQYLLAYGLILVGAWISKEGYKVYLKTIEELIPKKNIFRR